MHPSEIGVIKGGPVRKWMAAKKEWDTKFASAKRRVQKQRAKEMRKGYQQFGAGEVPPPSALAGRRKTGEKLREEKRTKSMGMTLWALWGSKHDEKANELELEADREPETTTASAMDGAGARPLHDTKTQEGKQMDLEKKPEYSRSRSRTYNFRAKTASLSLWINVLADVTHSNADSFQVGEPSPMSIKLRMMMAWMRILRHPNCLL